MLQVRSSVRSARGCNNAVQSVYRLSNCEVIDLQIISQLVDKKSASDLQY